MIPPIFAGASSRNLGKYLLPNHVSRLDIEMGILKYGVKYNQTTVAVRQSPYFCSFRCRMGLVKTIPIPHLVYRLDMHHLHQSPSRRPPRDREVAAATRDPRDECQWQTVRFRILFRPSGSDLGRSDPIRWETCQESRKEVSRSMYVGIGELVHWVTMEMYF